MFTKKATVAFLALAFMFVMPLAAANGSSGAAGDVKFDDSSVNIGEFNENSSGRLTVVLLNYNNDDTVDDGAITVNAWVTFLNGTDRLDSRENIVIPMEEGTDPGRVTVDFYFRIGTPGTYWVTVHVEPADLFISDTIGEDDTFTHFNSAGYRIEVSSSIWNDTSTYIVIIIVVIIIAIAIFLKLRSNSGGKNKKDNAGVFTAMEAEKKNKAAAPEYDDEEFDDIESEDEPPAEDRPKTEKPKAEKQTKSTEKQEYVGKVSSSKSKKSSPQRKSKRR